MTSDRSEIPFRDLEGVLNDQFHVMSDLFTGICLCLRTLSYNKTMSWYSPEIWLKRFGWVTSRIPRI